ncbi:unnamed protein product [Allacma fusca]|uniref:DRBM domain-containing protein n=1 Tax=Allacma fusca TaxID=39272 RepID=A0A8J2LIP2_9HEXA|nr:unnamed protein product [Allacma fusca]
METPKKTETWNGDMSTFSTPAQPESPCHGMAMNSAVKDKTPLWTWISILFSAIILSNSIFCTLLLCHVAFTNQETRSSLLLLSTKLDGIIAQKAIPNFMTPAEDKGFFSDIKKGLMEPEAEMMEELVAAKSPSEDECPACPPCQPEEGIPTNKDPVSFINMIYHASATYTCKTVCLNPPVHIATLSILNHSETWEKKGITKKRSKQEAAFAALKVLNASLAEQVVFISEPYNPTCKSKSVLFGLEDGSKC